MVDLVTLPDPVLAAVLAHSSSLTAVVRLRATCKQFHHGASSILFATRIDGLLRARLAQNTDSSWSPLSWAVSKSSLALAQMLLQALEASPALKPFRRPEQEAALNLTAKLGKLQILESFLDSGLSPNLVETPGGPQPDGQTDFAPSPLTLACEHGHVDCVQLLIRHQANIHYEDDMSLAMAAINGHLPIVELLLEAGGSPNADNGYALTDSAYNGHTEVVRRLVDAGAYVNINRLESPLTMAASSGQSEIVKLLVEKGADVHAFDEAALIAAVARGHTEVAKYLLEPGSADINAALKSTLLSASIRNFQSLVELDSSPRLDANDGFLLRFAAKNNLPEFAALLLDHGADVHVKKNDPLRLAAEAGNLDMVDILLCRKADINEAFLSAIGAETPSTPTLDVLLQKGADVNGSDGAALDLAAEKGSAELIQYLVGKGADVAAHGGHALHMAAEHGHLEATTLLLDQGADIHDTNEYALRWACENKHTPVIKLLLQRGASVENALQSIWSAGHSSKTVLTLITTASELKLLDINSAFRASARYGYIEATQRLLGMGADLAGQEHYAVRWAARNGHYDIFKLLVSRGANVHAKGEYALMYASENGYADVVGDLIKLGAKVQANGGYAIKKATENGHAGVLRLLLKAKSQQTKLWK
ncbi:ankyrin repeat-containing domain protein [Polychytrium aggregatum]|uniref:ankyrin repeat-containing domain protein n=1 Tax=Polychytrium aggregatum TaxID=110093 RepID=UPI0022FE939B|nr:ankyrin repeat-containing domain protein [Polychytrium aggregatum]KAI9199718.1 ankyrin repeat-containing domain protein [Polychytrium aggregatum]